MLKQILEEESYVNLGMQLSSGTIVEKIKGLLDVDTNVLSCVTGDLVKRSSCNLG